MPTSTEFNRIQLDLRPTSEEAKSVPPAAPNQTKSVAVTIAARQDRRLAGVLPVRRNQARCRCVLARRARYTKRLELAVYVRVHFPPLHSIHRSVMGWAPPIPQPPPPPPPHTLYACPPCRIGHRKMPPTYTTTNILIGISSGGTWRR
jgi:hypothetical protein